MGSTIDDVAARAGVSTATVSRALRGMSNVSDQSRRKVLAAAEELGYVVSPSAQALATGRTGMVALILPDFDEWYPSAVLEGAQRRLQSKGFTTLVHSVDYLRSKPHLDLDVGPLRRRVDGVLVISLPLVGSEIVSVQSLGVPVVLVGNANPPLASISVDDVEIGLIATQHLLELGHTVIGHITGALDEVAPSMPAGARLEGWRQAMLEAGQDPDPDLVEHAYFDIGGGHDAMMELLNRRPDVTAVFAAADCIAAGAIRALEERGLGVPGDVSVIGVDGEYPAELLPLTTVVQDPGLQGRMGADSLARMISGGAVSGTQWVHGSLRPGHTTSVPR
ncbi:MAG: LacI family transcriptional regulator [Actinomyces sp.]|nr:LacI family transcriptional regulator [Actinomyces sp.]